MKKFQTLLIAAVIALMILNIGLIVFIWKGHRRLQHGLVPPHEERMQRNLSSFGERLGLEPEQKQAFQQAFKSHNEEMEAIEREERSIRQQIHRAVFAEDKSAIDSLTLAAQQLTQERIVAYTEFSRQLAENATPEQREKLNKILSRISDNPPLRKKRSRGIH